MPIREKIEEFMKKAISTARYVALPNADKTQHRKWCRSSKKKPKN